MIATDSAIGARGALAPSQLVVKVEALGFSSLPLGRAVDFVGIVADVGADVTGIARHGRVFGSALGEVCEPVIVVESSLTRSCSTSLSAVELVTLPTAVAVASRGLELARAFAGERVLIVGAASARGAVAVQLAQARGLVTVGMCRDRNVPFVRDLGAHETLAEDRLSSLSIGKFDVIFDADGTLSPRAAKTLLKPTGCSVHAHEGTIVCHRAGATTSETTLPNRRTLDAAVEATIGGCLVPIIDRVYPSHSFSKARQRARSSHVRGCVVVGYHDINPAGPLEEQDFGGEGPIRSPARHTLVVAVRDD